MHTADGIGPMGIKPRRYEYQLWIEAIRRRCHHLPENGFVCVKPGSRWQGDVNGCAQSCSLPTFFCQSCAWIKWSLVRGEVEHSWIIIEHLLGTISMMHIVIDNHDAFELILIDG